MTYWTILLLLIALAGLAVIGLFCLRQPKSEREQRQEAAAQIVMETALLEAARAVNRSVPEYVELYKKVHSGKAGRGSGERLDTMFSEMSPVQRKKALAIIGEMQRTGEIR